MKQDSLIEKYKKLDQAECMVEAGEVLKDIQGLLTKIQELKEKVQRLDNISGRI